MDFYRLLRRSEFPGNLLVQHARNDQLHYLELARGQQIEKAPRLILLSTVSSLLGGPNQGVLNALQ
jgi:hypothetical protein